MVPIGTWLNQVAVFYHKAIMVLPSAAATSKLSHKLAILTQLDGYDLLHDSDYEPESETQSDNSEDEARSQLQNAAVHNVEVNVPDAPAAVDPSVSRWRKRARNMQCDSKTLVNDFITLARSIYM